MNEWKPIKTAPKDKGILLANRERTVCGFWEEDDRIWCYHDYPDSYNLYDIKPTHWRVLPNLSQAIEIKGILEFDLLEQAEAHQHAVNGSKYHYAIGEIRYFIRQTLKHLELTDKEHKRLELVEEKIAEEMEDIT